MTGRRSHGRLSALNGVVHQGIAAPASDQFAAVGGYMHGIARLHLRLREGP